MTGRLATAATAVVALVAAVTVVTWVVHHGADRSGSRMTAGFAVPKPAD